MDPGVLPLPRGSSWLKGTDGRRTASVNTGKVAERRASNRIQVRPASPEIISSLISSLSAISTPAENLFDSLLPNTPTGSVPPSPTTPLGFAHPSNTPSVRTSACADPTVSQEQNKTHIETYLHPDDAAIPPVIRTSKPPSGFSPLTAPKKVSPTRSNKTAGWSPPGSRDHSPPRSIGSVSIEPRHGQSSSSVNTVESGKTRSGRSLGFKASKERIREVDRERKKFARNVMEDDAKSPKKYAVIDMDRLLEDRSEENLPSSPALPRDAPSLPAMSARELSTVNASLNTNPEEAIPEDRPGGIGGGRTIPARDSSLRHSSTSASPKRKRKSRRSGIEHSESQIKRPSKVTELDGPKLAVLVDGGVNEDDGVVKRIKELKAQKELRRMELQGRAHSDDERQRGRDRQREKKTTPGRSSLPAPSAPKGAMVRSVSDSEAFGKENKDPETSGAFESVPKGGQLPKSMSMPVVPAAERRGRIASNQIASGIRMTMVDDRPSTADSIDEAVEDYMTAPRLSQRIYHPQTGRAISFSEVGDANGSVVFCCVGMGTTRYLTAFYDELALSLRLRLITLDRPGIGDSQPHADGSDTPLGWPGEFVTALFQARCLMHSRRYSCSVPTPRRLPLLPLGPFCWSNLRSGYCVTHAAAHPRPHTPPGALDTAISDGGNRHTPRARTSHLVAVLPAHPPLPSHTVLKGSKLQFLLDDQLFPSHVHPQITTTCQTPVHSRRCIRSRCKSSKSLPSA